MQLPESWQFLGTNWWILHVVSILLVFGIGYLVGRASMEGPEDNVIPPPPSFDDEDDEPNDKQG